MNFKQAIRFGNYTDSQKSRLIEHINLLIIDEKHEYEVLIKPFKQSKTLEQLGYYFSTIVPITAEWKAVTIKQAHVILKKECLEPVFFSALDGTSYEYKPSVKHMNIKPMAKYIQDCTYFLGSEGQYVPAPTYKS